MSYPQDLSLSSRRDTARALRRVLLRYGSTPSPGFGRAWWSCECQQPGSIFVAVRFLYLMCRVPVLMLRCVRGSVHSAPALPPPPSRDAAPLGVSVLVESRILRSLCAKSIHTLWISSRAAAHNRAVGHRRAPTVAPPPRAGPLPLPAPLATTRISPGRLHVVPSNV